MKIIQVTPRENGVLVIVSDDGSSGIFDVTPYMESSAFSPLKDHEVFSKVYNGGYFIEWECGADLSVDTIEARWIKA